MKLSARMLAAGLTIATAVAVHAQATAPAVPAQVTTVATGGEWTSARTAGTLRAVLIDEGFEHVHSKLWLEWLRVGDGGERRLVARVLVKELSDGFAVLRLDERRAVFQGQRIHLRATNPYSLEDKDVTIEAGKPGQYKIIARD